MPSPGPRGSPQLLSQTADIIVQHPEGPLGWRSCRAQTMPGWLLGSGCHTPHSCPHSPHLSCAPEQAPSAPGLCIFICLMKGRSWLLPTPAQVPQPGGLPRVGSPGPFPASTQLLPQQVSGHSSRVKGRRPHLSPLLSERKDMKSGVTGGWGRATTSRGPAQRGCGRGRVGPG